MEDIKEEEERIEMDDELYYTCLDGPLEELKKKINSSNINSRESDYVFIFDN